MTVWWVMLIWWQYGEFNWRMMTVWWVILKNDDSMVCNTKEWWQYGE